MKPDRKRKFGFYWVRFEGEILVAEYDPLRRGWYIPGTSECFKDKDVCELLGGKLIPLGEPEDGQ
jgi:hypothetical protein